MSNFRKLLENLIKDVKALKCKVYSISDSITSYSMELSKNGEGVNLLDSEGSVVSTVSLSGYVKISRTVGFPVISFTKPTIFGSFSFPLTTPLSTVEGRAIVGIQQKIYHQAASFTPPAGWVLLGSGVYMPDEVNIIYAEWCEAGRVEYWITQDV